MRPAGFAAAAHSSRVPPYPAALMIVGADWHSRYTYEGRVLLARPSIQIGRMESNDLIISDQLISRHHAVIRWAERGYEIEDLGSVNGTFVRGHALRHCMLLAPGDTVKLGNTTLYFVALEASEQDPAHVRPPSQDAPVFSPHMGLEILPGGSPGPHQTPGAMPLSIMPASPAPPVHPYMALFGDGPARLSDRIGRELHKRYWRLLVVGLLAFAVVAAALSSTQNLHLVPLEMLIASALVPVVFVVFCWEQSAFVDMPAPVVGMTFMGGAVVGLTISALIEPLVVPLNSTSTSIGLMSAIIIALCEESAKVVSVAWVLRDRRLNGELDGLILGAAAGMGFAALETAGYGFVAFLSGFMHASAVNTDISVVILAGIHAMSQQLIARMALAFFGHGIWTALVCAVIWRDRGTRAFRLTSGVILAFALAVTLHALWDWSPLLALLPGNIDPAVVNLMTFGWFTCIGLVGLAMLRVRINESIAGAKAGASTRQSATLVPAFASAGPSRVPVATEPLVTSATQAQFVSPVRCPHCGTLAGQRADRCPNCGNPLAAF